jgi:hypothetical protein
LERRVYSEVPWTAKRATPDAAGATTRGSALGGRGGAPVGDGFKNRDSVGFEKQQNKSIID